MYMCFGASLHYRAPDPDQCRTDTWNVTNDVATKKSSCKLLHTCDSRILV